MKNQILIVLPLIYQIMSVSLAEEPKTNSSSPIDPLLLNTSPYRQTGLVLTGQARGSGFVASDRKLFFSAAQVVREEASWVASPEWYSGVNDASTPSEDDAVQSRGYFRWDKYATMSTKYGGDSKQALANDVILAWSVADFIAGEPAVIDFSGSKRLVSGQPCMITGYPETIEYDEMEGEFYQHATALRSENFETEYENYKVASLISTGPGNTGGPVWTQDASLNWMASGVLVSGRPSEIGVYGMNNSVKSLLKAASPAILNPREKSVFVGGLSGTSYFWQTTKPKNIPDGLHKFTIIPLKLSKYPVDAKVSSLILNLDISTAHVGDLVVWLQSPDGVVSVLHDSEGAGEDNLIKVDKDLSSEFEGALANGKWQLKIQDRLKGDIAIFNSLKLEVGTD